MMRRWPARGLLLGADRRRRLQAVHLRHLHVHEHQVERLPPQEGKRLLAVVRHHDRMAPLFQERQRQALVDRAVLRQQDTQPTPGCGRQARSARGWDQALHRRMPQRRAHGVEQLRLFDGLSEIAGDAQRPGTAAHRCHDRQTTPSG